ncbi:MAG TPA: ATP-binding protein [Planctomycetota bacterium]|nr:ATP-binding protein [Planctomycetota bacterium]
MLFYRLIDAVHDSLDRAGREGYTLDRLNRTEAWLDFGEFQDFLDEAGFESVPLVWEGRPLRAHDELRVNCRTGNHGLWRYDRTGQILLHGDALFCLVTVLPDDGVADHRLIVGERRPGALQQMIHDYADYGRRRTLTDPWITVVGRPRLPRRRDLGWDSMVLDPGFRDDLRTQIAAFFSNRDEYRRLKVAHRRGILFTGPPGNGKTSAIRVIASVRPEPFILYTMNCSTDTSDLDEAFDKAAIHAPAILCFEDVDSVFTEGSTLSHFLNRIDGLHPLEGVLILATTNHPEKLDAALTERPSRFDRVFHFANPAAPERRRALRDGLGPVFDERLVAETDGFSMAQLQEIRVSACLESIHAGLPGPTIQEVLRSIDRLRGQKSVAERNWDTERLIGFQWTRASEARNEG